MTRSMSTGAMLLLAAGWTACGAGAVAPAAIDPAHDTCAECRMLISDVRLGAEIVAPGEEPTLFDDIGCLRAFLKRNTPPPGAVAYVADHLSGAWVRADAAIYTQSATRSTPMASGILAHADPASRDRDPAASGGQSLRPSDVVPLAATAGEDRR